MMLIVRVLVLALLLHAPPASAQPERRGNGEPLSSPIGRSPVMRAPTTGQPVVTSLPYDERSFPGAEVFQLVPPVQDLADDARPARRQRGSCISTQSIREARVMDDSTIRLRLRNNKLVDMKLRGTCFGLAFDESFYYQPGPTMQLCERFDTIVARSGHRCLIDSFVPVDPKASPR